jgi:hypothetical protein
LSLSFRVAVIIRKKKLYENDIYIFIYIYNTLMLHIKYKLYT